MPQGPHSLPCEHGLGAECLLPLHVSCQCQVVIFAPASHICRVRFHKTVCQMVDILVSEGGRRVFSLFPYNLGQMFKERSPVCSLKALIKIIGEGQADRLFLLRKIQVFHLRKLRLICKYGRNTLSKVSPHFLIIPLMGDVDKTVKSRLIQGIDIGLVVPPGRFLINCQVGVPYGFPVPAPDTLLLLCHIFFQIPHGEPHPVCHDKVSFGFLPLTALSLECLPVLLVSVQSGWRKQKIPLSVLDILCHIAAAESRCVPVLIIEPAEHVLLLCRLIAV